MNTNQFKEKWFWIFLLILILSGAICYTLLEIKNKKLREAKLAICIDSKNLMHPSIIAIERLDYKEKYIALLTDTILKNADFPWTVIDNYQEVRILDYTNDSTLVKVAISHDIPTRVKSSYKELWVWEKFIKLK